MFREALKKAMSFTKPVFFVDYEENFVKLAEGMGTYFIINEEGWILTVAHIFKTQNGEIAKNRKFSWNASDAEIDKLIISETDDMALVKLTPFKEENVQYPKFKNPEKNIDTGVFLCKLGFPFNEIKLGYDKNSDSITFSKGSLPVTFFPLEGMYTRNVLDRKSELIEISTPGIPGQSGGPIFDKEGIVWSIITNNTSIKLEVPIPNQYIHLTWGIHPKRIVEFLRKNNIKFEMER